MSDTPQNSYIDGPLGAIYAKTALPIIFVMGMNGLLTVVDALFLGHFVGAEALAAVTLMFPPYMLIAALATLVSSGMSSLLARHLGGQRIKEAQAVFAGAHGLSLLVCGTLIVLFLLGGAPVALLAAGGSEPLAKLGLTYLRITVLFSPLMFLLSVNSDALRNEGRVGFMAVMSLLVSFANIGFDYMLIAQLHMGVAGSAYGTVLAQALALAILVGFRMWGRTSLRLAVIFRQRITTAWKDILALGAPQSLSFVGLALGSGTIVFALQMVGAENYQATLSAYGIITRVMTFAYLPLLGLSFAMQTITGNNYGAGNWQRSDKSIRIALLCAFAYCAIVQTVLSLFAPQIGKAFVADPAVIQDVSRILPIMMALYFLAGPQMMISAYFQAIGDAGRAAIIGLSKQYLFAIPLTLILGLWMGERGIWFASPIAEAMLAIVTTIVLTRIARKHAHKWGLFREGQTAKA